MEHAIWKIGLFKKIDNEKAKCIECNIDLKLSNRSIKALKTHLFSTKFGHDKSEYAKKYEQLEAEKAEASEGTSKNKITNFMIHSSGNVSALDKRVINFITENNLAFNIINSRSFHVLFRNMSEEIKDESHYRRILPDIFNQVKIKLQTELDSCNFFSFTSDVWTANTTNDSFISLTANGISKLWQRKNYILAIRHFPGTHSGKRIAIILSEILKEWNLEKKSHAFLTDSGANIKKAFEEKDENGCPILAMENSSCAAHDLNLCVKKCFAKDDLAPIFEKARKIVGNMKHSALATGIFQDIQIELDLPTNKLLQDVATRWNSTLLMLERLTTNKLAVNEFLFRQKKYDLILTEGEWNILENIQKLLKPLHEATLQFCTSESTLSTRLPLAYSLIRMLKNLDLNVTIDGQPCKLDEVEDMRSRLITDIEKRFISKENRLWTISTFLDPRFKSQFTNDKRLFFAQVSTYIHELLDTATEPDEQFSVQLIEQNDLAPPAKKKCSILDSIRQIATSSNEG